MNPNRRSDEPPGDGLETRQADRDARRARRHEQRLARRERTRRRILRSTAVLPSLFTVSNGLLGFASIHLASRNAIGSNEPGMLGLAAWLLFGAMVCDMIDGRLARFTRRTSDFGGQLDSLCDVISFGLAPAVLMVQTVMGAVHANLQHLSFVSGFGVLGIERVLWCIGGVYVACAALRLARFNVENEPDESAHMDFRGLPSPGAAAAVASLVILLKHVLGEPGGWIFASPVRALEGWIADWLAAAIYIALPLVTLATGLLMVSRFRYAHVVNQYIRGKRSFNYLVRLVVLVLFALLAPFLALATGATVYAASGPASAAWRHLRKRHRAAPAAAGDADEEQ